MWLSFFIALVPVGYNFIFGEQVDLTILSLSKKALLPFLAILIGLAIYKSIAIEFTSIFDLYMTLSGFFSDVFSYCRLLALGLVTVAIAQTINELAKTVTAIPFGIGYLLAVLILACGHTFNLIMSALGAFVHSLRLQYVEFFSKFFEGGGEGFKPFKENRQFTIVTK